jgi:PAS domain S-box-containing protein
MLGGVAIAVDITKRRFAAEELRISSERLALALRGANDGLWEWDHESRSGYFSPRFYTMLGYESGEFPPTFEAFSKLVHPDDLAPMRRAYNEQLAREGGRFEFEFRMRAKDGSWRWILSRGTRLAGARAGEKARIAGTHSDITERKQIQLRLFESEERHRKLVEQIPGVFYTAQALESPIFTFVSPQIERYTGFLPQDLVAVPNVWSRMIHPEDRAAYFAAYRNACAGRGDFCCDYRVVIKGGSVKWLRDEARVIFGDNGKPENLHGFLSDITEQKCTQEELLRKMRELEIIGRATIEREVKMVELKNKLKQYEAS